MTPRDPVLEAASRFRDAVNLSEVQPELMESEQNWGQLCSAMDAIQDTQSAIDAWRGGAATDDLGERYLRVYGVLQALFLQQDALKHAAEGVGEEWEPTEDLRAIRIVRNQAIGHPTKQGSQDASFGIVQWSMTTDSFELSSFSHRRTGGEFSRQIDLPQLADAQVRAVSIELNRLAALLERRAAPSSEGSAR